MDTFDTVVFIGRFQPPHSGHVEVMKQAMIQAKKNFIIMVGSINGPRTYKNPFTFEQRADVIQTIVKNTLGDFRGDLNVQVVGLRDSRYNNDEWIEQVQTNVANIAGKDGTVAIIGHKKDETSAYLDWFPQWKTIPVELDEQATVIDATTVRNILFEGLNPGFVKGVLPDASYKFLEQFKTSREYARIRDEYEVVKAYKKSWESAPYPPIFVCADAVVLCAGHILMIQRGAQPGKGQWALPGGHLNQNETVLECALRELIEETKIDVPEKVLRGSINLDKGGVVFDHPNRSLRGRTITHAFRFDIALAPNGKLPKVKGSDDAAKAKWVQLSELDENTLFEDHASIIERMKGG